VALLLAPARLGGKAVLPVLFRVGVCVRGRDRVRVRVRVVRVRVRVRMFQG